VRQGFGALNELAKLMPDTAERLRDDVERGGHRRWSGSAKATCCWCAPAPASGRWRGGGRRFGCERSHDHGESRPVSKEPGAAVIAGRSTATAACGCASPPRGATPPWRASCVWCRRRSAASRRPRCWQIRLRLAVLHRPGRGCPHRHRLDIASGFNVTVIERVATVLVIACPHALGLAIPLWWRSTTALGARNGILCAAGWLWKTPADRYRSSSTNRHADEKASSAW